MRGRIGVRAWSKGLSYLCFKETAAGVRNGMDILFGSTAVGVGCFTRPECCHC